MTTGIGQIVEDARGSTRHLFKIDPSTSVIFNSSHTFSLHRSPRANISLSPRDAPNKASTGPSSCLFEKNQSRERKGTTCSLKTAPGRPQQLQRARPTRHVGGKDQFSSGAHDATLRGVQARRLFGLAFATRATRGRRRGSSFFFAVRFDQRAR
mmetsp:Transcript_44965/g.137344  ORF Transcript_44965/g.137344 Transcript_44965/m.137344 type:complete len:154 (+) Transcript_44965:85-546(+)